MLVGAGDHSNVQIHSYFDKTQFESYSCCTLTLDLNKSHLDQPPIGLPPFGLTSFGPEGSFGLSPFGLTPTGLIPNWTKPRSEFFGYLSHNNIN